MQRSLRKVSIALGATFVALSFSGFASAKSSDPYLKQVEVSYSDLDLGRVSDARCSTNASHARHIPCAARFRERHVPNGIRQRRVFCEAIGDGRAEREQREPHSGLPGTSRQASDGCVQPLAAHAGCARRAPGACPILAPIRLWGVVVTRDVTACRAVRVFQCQSPNEPPEIPSRKCPPRSDGCHCRACGCSLPLPSSSRSREPRARSVSRPAR